ncbi:ParB/RepB/Spo0J family partition protein [Candidatus Wolfebacteria bacterium]|nr:ParB/RepB/Spo0J family partition protein [Candidatus Wolfebacteria bacterium]
MADENQDISSTPVQPLVQVSADPEPLPMIIEKAGPIQPPVEIKETSQEAIQIQGAPQKDIQVQSDFSKRSDFHHHHKAPESNAIFQIEVDKIKPNPYQPRKNFDEESLKELAASIREFGIIQPIVVSKIEKETENGTAVEYQLIAGERRLMAAKMAGLERAPAIIRRVSRGQEQMELAIVENIQRANLNPIETARAYARLSDEFRLTQREIAVRVGKSRETIANSLRLLNLPTDIQNAVAENKIGESQARLLLMIDDPVQQTIFFGELLNKNLSVRELRNRIKKTDRQQASDNQSQKSIDPEMRDLEERLRDLFGAPVKIEKEGDEGKIIISFYSPEEIEGILKKIKIG